MTELIRTTSVVVDGVRTPLLRTGPEVASEAVVFVHGNPGPASDWAGLLTGVGEFAPTLAPDLPGFGAAEAPAGFDYSIRGYARHLGGLLQQLGVERAHIVAHDFGGPWALGWAVENPDIFASAALINTGVLFDYRWHRVARIWRTPLLGELFQAGTNRAAFRRVVARDNPRLPSEAIDRIYDSSRDRGTRRAVLRVYRATPPTATEGFAPALRTFDRPALVLWGTYDAYLPWQQAERQREAFPSARVELLEGLGHWPHLEDRWRVSRALVGFLREQYGRSGQPPGRSGQPPRPPSHLNGLRGASS